MGESSDSLVFEHTVLGFNMVFVLHTVFFCYGLKAVKTAVGAVTPIEPFRLYHGINENVQKCKAQLEKIKSKAFEQPDVPGRSKQPVGLALIGFACFWPEGGGLMPPSPSPGNNSQKDPQINMSSTSMEEDVAIPNN
jgi:hypothetical protein